jgi:hypothetical protein
MQVEGDCFEVLFGWVYAILWVLVLEIERGEREDGLGALNIDSGSRLIVLWAHISKI